MRSFIFPAQAVLLTLFLWTFAACEKESVETAVRFGFLLDGTGGKVNKTAAAGDIFFDDGFLNVKEIELEAELADDSEIEYEREQRMRIDLSTLQAQFVTNPLVLPAGTYKEIEFEVQLADDGNDPSLLLSGYFTDSNLDDIPLEIRVFGDISLETELENFTYDPSQVSTTMLIVPVSWFGNISLSDLENAARDANGTVVISANSNGSLYDQIIERIEDGFDADIDD